MRVAAMAKCINARSLYKIYKTTLLLSVNTILINSSVNLVFLLKAGLTGRHNPAATAEYADIARHIRVAGDPSPHSPSLDGAGNGGGDSMREVDGAD